MYFGHQVGYHDGRIGILEIRNDCSPDGLGFNKGFVSLDIDDHGVGVVLFAVIYNIWQNERIKKIKEENKNEFDD